MNLPKFLKIVNSVLSKKGYAIDIRDLSDREFYNYFEEDFTEEEARYCAEELVSDMIYDGELPDFNDLASVDFDDI
jgi:hypothetical protein